MKKVDQTIVGQGEGNCMQAVVATLLELELKKVPNFTKYENSKTTTPFDEMCKFMRKYGYEMEPIIIGLTDKPVSALDVTAIDGGINGYFYAEVPHPTLINTRHAVVVDEELNIVHDPNPDRLALELLPEDVIEFCTAKDDWYWDLNGNLKKI